MGHSSDAITPSRVLRGKRTAAEAIGHGQDDVRQYVAEIRTILGDHSDAGGKAVAKALSAKHDIHLNYMTLERWLEKHRTALVAGTLERPILFEDALPEDHAEKINAIMQREALAVHKRMHTEPRRLYGVDISHKRLRTYLLTRQPQSRTVRALTL